MHLLTAHSAPVGLKLLPDATTQQTLAARQTAIKPVLLDIVEEKLNPM